MSDWQPIETAPKDGTPVILYLRAPWSRVEMAQWYEPWKSWQANIYEMIEGDEVLGIGSAIPTHWMLLPAPPTPTKGDRADG